MITSLQNEQIKQVVSLHKNKGRDEKGEYLIEGKRILQEALQRKAPLSRIYYCTAKKYDGSDLLRLIEQASLTGIQTEEVSETVMRKITTTEEPQGLMAVVRKKNSDWKQIIAEKSTILLVLDNIQDPGNLGTILRTALAADVRQIVLTKGTVDLYNPKVMRSSMGSIFSQTVLTGKDPQEIVSFCHDKKYKLVVSSMEGKSVFNEHSHENFPLALVIGNEAFGVSDCFLKNAGKKYSIPMFNEVESLNAAMAAGIFLYELRRQGQFL